jgi:hypothetical protein
MVLLDPEAFLQRTVELLEEGTVLSFAFKQSHGDFVKGQHRGGKDKKQRGVRREEFNRDEGHCFDLLVRGKTRKGKISAVVPACDAEVFQKKLHNAMHVAISKLKKQAKLP